MSANNKVPISFGALVTEGAERLELAKVWRGTRQAHRVRRRRSRDSLSRSLCFAAAIGSATNSSERS
jgi:hypothetical protein